MAATNKRIEIMSKMKWRILGPEGGEETRDYIDSIRIRLGISRRALSEEKLNISNRTLHGWMTQNKIPNKYFEALERLTSEIENISEKSDIKQTVDSGLLSNYSDGELIAELVRRGLKINFGG